MLRVLDGQESVIGVLRVQVNDQVFMSEIVRSLFGFEWLIKKPDGNSFLSDFINSFLFNLFTFAFFHYGELSIIFIFRCRSYTGAATIGNPPDVFDI